MKAPGKHNRATAAHIPDGISERDGFAGQVHREFFVQSSKDRILAAIDAINRQPVVHAGWYEFDEAIRISANRVPAR